MKKLIFLPIILLILATKLINAQTFNEDYLDGTIMFKLNDLIEVSASDYEKTDDGIGLVENISDYPYLNDIFDWSNCGCSFLILSRLFSNTFEESTL